MSEEEGECPGADTVFPLGVVLPDNSMPVVRHTHDHQYEMGSIRPLEDGKPIQGELVSLEGKPGEWCKVKPMIKTKTKGPAKVNSREYIEGWTNIFGHQDYGVS